MSHLCEHTASPRVRASMGLELPGTCTAGVRLSPASCLGIDSFFYGRISSNTQRLPRSSQHWGQQSVFKTPCAFPSHEGRETTAGRQTSEDSQTSGAMVCTKGTTLKCVFLNQCTQ